MGQKIVTNVRIATDSDTGRKRGFGYVDVINKNEAEKVYEVLHENEFLGRKINVDFAENKY